MRYTSAVLRPERAVVWSAVASGRAGRNYDRGALEYGSRHPQDSTPPMMNINTVKSDNGHWLRSGGGGGGGGGGSGILTLRLCSLHPGLDSTAAISIDRPTAAHESNPSLIARCIVLACKVISIKERKRNTRYQEKSKSPGRELSYITRSCTALHFPSHICSLLAYIDSELRRGYACSWKLSYLRLLYAYHLGIRGEEIYRGLGLVALAIANVRPVRRLRPNEAAGYARSMSLSTSLEHVVINNIPDLAIELIVHSESQLTIFRMARKHPGWKVYLQYALLARGVEPGVEDDCKLIRYITVDPKLMATNRSQTNRKSALSRDTLVNLIQSIDTVEKECRAKASAVGAHAGAGELNKSRPDIDLLESYKTLILAANGVIEQYLVALTSMLEEERRHNFSDGYRSLNFLEERINVWKSNLEGDRQNIKTLSEVLAKAKTRADLEETFLDDRLNGQWRGAMEFGDGANLAGLWVKVDENDTIVNVSPLQSDYHRNPAFELIVTRSISFANKFYQRDTLNGTPLEAYFANKCAAVSNRHFARVGSWHLDRVKYILTLYSPFCANGDLKGMIVKSVTSDTPLPEPVTLTTDDSCAAVLKHASLCEMDPQAKDSCPTAWKHFHGPARRTFPSISHSETGMLGSLAMADFGLAIETFEGDPNNPSNYNKGAGSKPFASPEQFNKKQRIDLSGSPNVALAEPRLWEWTNVYSVSLINVQTNTSPAIGVVMYQMYHNWILHRAEQKFLVPDESQWDMINDAVPRSPNLANLISRCIETNPENRISLDELYEGVRNLEPQGQPAMAQYLQEGLNGSQPENEEFDVTFGSPVKYAIGMAYREESGFESSDMMSDVQEEDGLSAGALKVCDFSCGGIEIRDWLIGGIDRWSPTHRQTTVASAYNKPRDCLDRSS
ncbi:uncharacterized protein MYCFIDRAFT_174275 [Pseudocercospora fijiensis CIRAD86]|uniref:Protein kinase domain-containing protein n=1 Tax=Pseudocercospora fijiensis (strain CIRAD86) TaxID=383855 RepID=M3AZY1_PSEFD|nr:uncharacterized protein MYCFIDRAFT_174275 [Pseudocercospora fijiensis CIRAD86]EME82718.1 hypothetical protein MYCFIDRAFT_174275 [Pseudocercospora fijiensis CIRAD86]